MKTFSKLIAIAVAAASGYLITGSILETDATPAVDLSSYCLLSKTVCEHQGVSVQLEHDWVTPMAPTQIKVDWPQTNSLQLMIELQGLEMEMGTSKYLLKLQDNGQYAGTLLLPVCTESSMTWYGDITSPDSDSPVKVKLRMER